MTTPMELPTEGPRALLPGQHLTIYSPDDGVPLVRVVHGARGLQHEPHRVERCTPDGDPPIVLALFFAPGRAPAHPQAPRLPRPVAMRTGTIGDAIAYGQQTARDLWQWMTVDQLPGGGIS